MKKNALSFSLSFIYRTQNEQGFRELLPIEKDYRAPGTLTKLGWVEPDRLMVFEKTIKKNAPSFLEEDVSLSFQQYLTNEADERANITAFLAHHEVLSRGVRNKFDVAILSRGGKSLRLEGWPWAFESCPMHYLDSAVRYNSLTTQHKPRFKVDKRFLNLFGESVSVAPSYVGLSIEELLKGAQEGLVFAVDSERLKEFALVDDKDLVNPDGLSLNISTMGYDPQVFGQSENFFKVWPEIPYCEFPQTIIDYPVDARTLEEAKSQGPLPFSYSIKTQDEQLALLNFCKNYLYPNAYYDFSLTLYDRRSGEQVTFGNSLARIKPEVRLEKFDKLLLEKADQLGGIVFKNGYVYFEEWKK
jgi:hypothetical protein